MEIEEYLEIVSGQIRSKRARIMAVKEIEDHIKDQAGAYEEEGMKQETAMEEAVRQMGDPVTTGVELDRIHRPKMDWKLFWWIVLFSALGLAIQYLCFYRLGNMEGQFQIPMESSMIKFVRQCVYTAVGLVVMAGICLCDYSLIGKYGEIWAGVFLAGIWAACSPGILPRLNGSYPYLKCILYLFIPLYGGILYRNRGNRYKGLMISALWIAAVFLTGIKVIGGGLGVLMDTMAACFFMLLVAAWEDWFQVSKKMGLGFGATILIIPGIIFFSNNLTGYQIERLEVWLHPEQYATGAGYQVTTIRNIVSNLGINTSCYKALEQKGLLEFVSACADHYEYMMLQAAVTLGTVKVIFLGILFTAFLFYLFRMAAKEKNKLGHMIALGCTMLLAVQTIQNMMYNFGIGIISTSGVPFFSYGRVLTLVLYILFGVLLSIYRYQNLVWDEPIKNIRKSGELAKLTHYILRGERNENTLS